MNSDTFSRQATRVVRPQTPLVGPGTWKGPELRNDGSWIVQLTDSDIDELMNVVNAVRASQLPIHGVSRDRFPLASLGPRLVALRREVLDGRGFVLLRGFPVTQTSKEDAALAFWSISQYFGRAVPVNAEGHLVGHVVDMGADMSDPNARIYATNRAHRFHTDSTDIVGLLCLQTARSGGLSQVVSSVTIFNEMMKSNPELLDELFKPFPVTRKGETPPGKAPFYQMPVYHWFENRLSMILSRDFIEGSQRFPDAPPLSDLQVRALDRLEAMAADPQLRLDMELQPGDMQFLHNHQILHARSAYQDHPEPGRRRHLLRMWICPPDGRPLPAVFAERYGSVKVGDRGGIRLPGVGPSVPPLQPPRPWWMSKVNRSPIVEDAVDARPMPQA